MAFNMDASFRVTARTSGEQNIIRLRRNVDQLAGATDLLRRNFSSLTPYVATFVSAAAIKSAINAGDALNDLNIKTGVAVETLSKLKVVAEQNDSSLEGLAVSFKFLMDNQAEAVQGSKKAIQSFEQIGITVGQLKKLSTEELFLLLAERVGELGEESARTKVLTDTLGKSGYNLGVMMAQGSAGIKKAMDEAERFGLVLSKEDAMKMDEFNDKWTIFVNECQRWTQSGFVASFDTFMKIKNSMHGGDLRIPLDELNGVDQMKIRLETLQSRRQRTAAALLEEDDPEKFGALRDQVNQLGEQISAASAKIASSYGPFIPDAAVGKKPGRSLTGGALSEQGLRDREREIEQMQKYIEKERQGIITLQMEGQQIGLTTIEIEKMREARRIDAEVAEKTLTMSPQIQAQFKAQAEVIKQQRLEVMQLNYENSRTFAAGTQQALTEYTENLGDAASHAGQMWKNMLDGMNDSLTDFAMDGEITFGNFAQSIIRDMIKIQMQQSVTGPLAGMIGSLNPFGTEAAVRASIAANPAIFANGGIMTSGGSLPLNKYAGGGIANSPQMAVFGEGDMAEAYVPLPDGRSIPVTMRGGGGVINNIDISIDMGGSTQVSGDGGQAAGLARLMAATAKSVIANEMRPGGILSQQRMA